jgi:cell fate regulator YaaT (PSP1 superfamily)
MNKTLLVRYGAIPEVARFRINSPNPCQRNQQVVVRTHRGVEIGTVLEEVREEINPPKSNGSNNATAKNDDRSNFVVLRVVSDDDLSHSIELRSECESQFNDWLRRIAQWTITLELIDLEWMLDRGKLILYVLNDRGPECMKLALQAAAAGLGTVEVKPVGTEGLLPVAAMGGCGAGGS